MVSGGSGKVIAIAASTGGVEALEAILACFRATVPPIVVVQHMPKGFTKLFADRLNDKLAVSVKEAETGDVLQQGLVLVAPAGLHMRVSRGRGGFFCDCFHGPKVQCVIPSADVLFESVAKEIGSAAVGAVLTGMGGDGAQGLLQMRQAGARTIGQDRDTCTVYGMPKVAYDLGAVEFQLPLGKIADKLLDLAQ